MKNKELLKICYKFLNRFITADELIKMLNDIDKNKYSKEEREELDKLIKEIIVILNKTPNEVDEFIINKKKKINEMIEMLEEIPQNENYFDFLNKQIESLRNDYNKEIDSHKRWLAVVDYISESEYFNKSFQSLSDYELLEFIAQYISVPFPPKLKQEEFDRLVKVGIENDKREWLWRLAFNYEESNFDFDSIVDYFIEMKDGYYIAELISAVGQCLDVDKLIDKLNDKELIKDLKDRKGVIEGYVTEEQFNRMISKLN